MTFFGLLFDFLIAADSPAKSLGNSIITEVCRRLGLKKLFSVLSADEALIIRTELREGLKR